MGKTTKNFLVIIVIAIVVIFALVCLEYQHFRFEPISANNVETKGNILPDPNQGLNNMLNEILDDNIETEVKTEEKKNETTTASKLNSPFSNSVAIFSNLLIACSKFKSFSILFPLFKLFFCYNFCINIHNISFY